MLDNLPLVIYLIGMIDTLTVILALLIVALVGLGLVGSFGERTVPDKEYGEDLKQFRARLRAARIELKGYRKLGARLLKWSVLPIALFIATPSEETAYTMLAAYGSAELVKNEKVQELGGKSLDVLEKFMSEYLEEQDAN